MNLLGGNEEPDPQCYTNHGLRGDPQLYTGSGGRRVSPVVQGGGSMILGTTFGFLSSATPAQTADTVVNSLPDYVRVKADGDAGVFERSFVKLSKSTRTFGVILWGMGVLHSYVRGARRHRLIVEAILDADFDPSLVNWGNQNDLTYQQVAELGAWEPGTIEVSCRIDEQFNNTGALCAFRPQQGLAFSQATGLRISWYDDESYSTEEIAQVGLRAVPNDNSNFRLYPNFN